MCRDTPYTDAVGGIYTVIKSKAAETVNQLGQSYWCVLLLLIDIVA